ncbi:hypothetical protein C8R45DRAFT_1182976 [Mycena sanguinolenta]|nr:hypothetical protein C8R45DRAFT_1182976 [Mycena sanguinolenta]
MNIRSGSFNPNTREVEKDADFHPDRHPASRGRGLRRRPKAVKDADARSHELSAEKERKEVSGAAAKRWKPIATEPVHKCDGVVLTSELDRKVRRIYNYLGPPFGLSSFGSAATIISTQHQLSGDSFRIGIWVIPDINDLFDEMGAQNRFAHASGRVAGLPRWMWPHDKPLPPECQDLSIRLSFYKEADASRFIRQGMFLFGTLCRTGPLYHQTYPVSHIKQN